MKKVLLSLVFVLATSSLVNANSIVEKEQIDCIAFAFEVEEVLEYTMTYEKFARTVDSCEARFN